MKKNNVTALEPSTWPTWTVPALSAVAVILAITFIRDPFQQTIATTIAVYLIASAGFNVMSGYAGLMSLGHAGFMAVGAYSAAIGYRDFGWSMLEGIAFAIVISGLSGVLIALPALRLHGPYLAMVTLAFGLMVLQLATNFVGFTSGPQGVSIISPELVPGIEIGTNGIFVAVLISSCLVYLITRNLVATKWGRAFRALHSNDAIASSLGINVSRTRLIVFAFSAALTGLAGALLAYSFAYVNPDMFTFHASVMILAVAMVGGLGSPIGPVVGAMVLVGLNSGVFARTDYQHYLYGIALFVVAMFAPKGLAGFSQFTRWRKGSNGASSTQDATPGAVNAEEIAKVYASSRLQDRPQHGTIVLEASDLVKHFGHIKAVNGVSLRIRAGQVHGLIGPNGAGKSTVIDMLAGAQNQDSGSVVLGGTDVSRVSSYERLKLGLARTFQTGGLYPEFTLSENVSAGQHTQLKEPFLAALLGTRKIRRRESAAARKSLQLLDALGLRDGTTRKAGSLSYGSRRLLEIARALAAAPDVLLLDEPAAGLNPKEQAVLSTILKRLTHEGMAIILVEHHMKLVAEVCDEVTVLDQGTIIAAGPPTEVLESEEVITAYVGVPKTRGISVNE